MSMLSDRLKEKALNRAYMAIDHEVRRLWRGKPENEIQIEINRRVKILEATE